MSVSTVESSVQVDWHVKGGKFGSLAVLGHLVLNHW